MNFTPKVRTGMPSTDFALPGKRFPISDPTHARLAIGGATRAAGAGNISGSQETAIKAKARAKLGLKPGGTSLQSAMVQKLRGY